MVRTRLADAAGYTSGTVTRRLPEVDRKARNSAMLLRGGGWGAG
jgi:hypothetical protein